MTVQFDTTTKRRLKTCVQLRKKVHHEKQITEKSTQIEREIWFVLHREQKKHNNNTVI